MAPDDLTTLFAAILRGETTPGLAALTDHQCLALLQQSQAEGVAPLLYYHLHQRGALAECPPQLRENLRSLNLQEAAAELARMAENRTVLQRLQAAGLEFIVLKGEALAHWLYPQPHLRARCDTDLQFTDRKDAEQAWEQLRTLGYRRSFALEGELVGLQFVCSKAMAGDLELALDIHNSLCNNLWLGQRFDFGELLANSRPLNYQGLQVQILNTPWSLLHNCLHRLSNMSLGTEDRLIWRYDLHLLSREMTDNDWDQLHRITVKKGLAAFCLQALEKAEEAFPGTLPENHRRRLEQQTLSEPPLPGNLNRPWGNYQQSIQSQKSLADKARYIWQNLLPPPSYMYLRYQPRYKAQLPFLYIKRMVDFARKVKTTHHSA